MPAFGLRSGVVGQFVILTKEESQREHIEMLRSSARQDKSGISFFKLTHYTTPGTHFYCTRKPYFCR